MRWQQARAALIAIAIGFGLVDGCPLPEQPPDWERGLVRAVRSVQRVVEWPVAWIRPTLRVAQQWTLFQAADPVRYRMWIEGQRAGGTWQPVFRAGDPAYAEDGELLEYRRIRGAYDPTDVAPGQYNGFAGWMTARVLAAHLDFVAARIRLEQIRIGDGGFEPTGQFAMTYVRERGAP